MPTSITIPFHGAQPDLGAVEVGLPGGGGGGGGTTSYNFGKTVIGGTPSAMGANRKRAIKVTTNVDITATTMSAYLGPAVGSGTQAMRLILYSDSGGAPGNLLAVTVERVLNAASNPAGWYTFNFPASVTVPAGTYWIGIWTGATDSVFQYYFDTIGNARDYVSETYSSSANPSSPFGTPTVDSEQFSVYITGTGASGGGAGGGGTGGGTSSGWDFVSMYVNPTGSNGLSYNTNFDNIHAAIPNVTSVMAPCDVSVVNHIGVPNQCVLVYNGMTEANFVQYGLPCWQTGLVRYFLIWDEPDGSTTTQNQVRAQKAIINKYCPGALCVITGFSPQTLATLAAANPKVADVFMVDQYPARPSWDMTTYKACINTLINAGVLYGHVLDAFTAPNYPLPTAAQLQEQVNYVKTVPGVCVAIYAWGVTGGSPQLETQSDLQAVLKTLGTTGTTTGGGGGGGGGGGTTTTSITIQYHGAQPDMGAVEYNPGGGGGAVTEYVGSVPI